MKLVCLCCTYLRPLQLSSMIRDFVAFDYPDKELLIYDDVGQYPTEPAGENWRIISEKNKHPTLGEKRNALAEMAPQADGFVVMDDDDGYCAWTLQAHAEALQNGDVSSPSRILSEHRQSRQILMERGKGIFHGAWAYTPEAFKRAGGYSHKDTGEDRDLMKGFVTTGCHVADSCDKFPPYYIYRWHHTGSYHISGLSQKGRELLKDDWKRAPVIESLPDPAEPDWSEAVKKFFGIEGDISDYWIQHKADLLKRTEP